MRAPFFPTAEACAGWRVPAGAHSSRSANSVELRHAKNHAHHTRIDTMTRGSSGFVNLLFFLLSVIISYRSGGFVQGLPYGGGGLRQFDAIVVDAPSSPAASPVGPVIVSNPVVDTPLHDCPYSGYYYTPSSYSSSTYTTRQQPAKQQQQQHYYYQPSSYYQQQATRDDSNYYNSYQSNYYYRPPSINTLSGNSQYYARNSNYQVIFVLLL